MKLPSDARVPTVVHVSPFVKGALGDSLKNPLEFREVFKMLWRAWRELLSPAQTLVVLFIFDRTAAWGRQWEVIPLRHFVRGVYGTDGTCYALPVGLSQPVITAALAYLEQTGLVFRRKKGKCFAYALNYSFTPPSVINNMASISVPKRLQSGSKVKDSYTQTASRVKDSYTHKSKERDKSKEPCASEAVAVVKQTATQALAATDRREQAKAERLTAEGVLALWHRCCRPFVEQRDMLSTTKTDGAILARYVRRLRQVHTDPVAYFSWLAENWSVVRAEFSWMSSTTPSVPSIRFVVRFSNQCENAFREGRKIAQAVRQGGEARDVAMVVRHKRVSHATAAREVQERSEVQTLQNRTSVYERIKAARKAPSSDD